MLLYGHNKINKRASIRIHRDRGNPTGKERVLWVVLYD